MPHPDPRSESESTRPAAVSAVNLAAAEWLHRLADDLELREPALTRRIAAYRLAAESLRRSPLRVEDLWSAGREHALTRIEHVTPAVAQLIGDLISTKRITLPAGDPFGHSGRR